MEKNPCGFLDVKYISDYHLFQIRQQILECAVCTVTFVQWYRFHQSVKIVMSDIILVLGGGGRFLSEHQKIQWRIKNSCDIGESIYSYFCIHVPAHTHNEETLLFSRQAVPE